MQEKTKIKNKNLSQQLFVVLLFTYFRFMMSFMTACMHACMRIKRYVEKGIKENCFDEWVNCLLNKNVK